MTLELVDVYHLVLFQYELLDRSIGKNSLEVVSYPTNDFLLCSPLDRNFGVILHCTLRDGYMIQLYQHCRVIIVAKVRTLGLNFKHCNTVCAPFYYLLPCCFYGSNYKNSYLLSTLHFYHHLFAELVHLYNLPLYWVCWGHKRFLVFGWRVV